MLLWIRPFALESRNAPLTADPEISKKVPVVVTDGSDTDPVTVRLTEGVARGLARARVPRFELPADVYNGHLAATRDHIKPQLGPLASLLVTDLPDVKTWVARGDAPAFLKFEGPLYLMGRLWRIEWN